jgi:hypothetical protein
MPGRFSSFILLAGMRTGSNFLEANLNALPGVYSHGELFNPHFIGKKDQTSLLGHDLVARAADPMGFWQLVREGSPGLHGFRFFRDHDPRVLNLMLADPTCAKIVLTRNPADTYVSLKIAQGTGQWKVTNAKNLKPGTMRFDAAEFERHLNDEQAFQMHILHTLQTSGQTTFYIDYDDLRDIAVLNGLAEFLGIPGRLDTFDGRLKKQNPDEIAVKVENSAEMAVALDQMDRFNLGRTPNFEPRRAPMVPGFVASQGAGLLFMPIRGGPEIAVTEWLSGLGSGGLIQNFSQKSLRQWKNAQPVLRAFTVVRHPALRSFLAYQALLSGDLPDLHALMVRGHKLDLPSPDQHSDTGLMRAGFMAFLQFAGMTLAGQTGLRVPIQWASQTAILEAINLVQTPDAILREERLGEGLAFLANEVGQEMRVFHPEDAFKSLGDIYDENVESAVRSAYKRDYQTFGFRRWR